MHEVIIVGGGPVGLMLALELSLAGVRPLVLERDEHIDPTVKAGSLNGPAADALRRRGLAVGEDEPFPGGPPVRTSRAPAPRHDEGSRPAASAAPTRAAPPFPFVGHVAGLLVRGDLVRYEQLEGGVRPLVIRQQQVQEVLERRLAESDLHVRRGVHVTDVRSEFDRAVVATDDGDLEAHWVVGADGGRSIVRKSTGFAFPGLDGIMTGHQAVVAGEGLEDIPLGWRYSPTGVYRRLPNNLILTAEFDGAPEQRDATVTAQELTGAIRRVTGVPVTVTEVFSATRFTDNTRVVDHYRRGRVLLAGDAAHVHPPFGGQGLSLGMLDATSLGWRLAGVVEGRLDESVFDDYESERRPEAERILEWSRAQIGIMRTDERSRASGRLVQRLMNTPDGATEAVRVISGAVVSYAADDGPIGTYAADWPAADPDASSLFGLTTEGHIVVAHRPHAAVPSTIAARAVRMLATDSSPAAYTLIRPDGVIAWTGDDSEGLGEALTALGR